MREKVEINKTSCAGKVNASSRLNKAATVNKGVEIVSSRRNKPAELLSAHARKSKAFGRGCVNALREREVYGAAEFDNRTIEGESFFNKSLVSHLSYSLVLHCASLLRTIFASSARANECVHVQNVRDFPQTNFDSDINSPFLLNEHGDPRFFSQVFTKNSLIKNIFEEEKKFDCGTRFFFGK